MKIDLEMHASIFGPDPDDAWRDAPEYCFTHAVQRAIRGEQLTLRVQDGSRAPYYCDDCRKERDRDI